MTSGIYTRTEEHNKNMGKSITRVWQNPLYKKKVSEKIKLSLNKPDIKEKVSKIRKKLWQNQKYIKNKTRGQKLANYKHPKELKEKMSNIKKEHWKSEEYRKKIPHNGMLGKKHSKEAIEIIREKNSGKNNFHYGKPIANAKRVLYNNILFKSSWEVIYARWLDLQGYDWQYEPKRFYFKNFSYLPDFWVEELKSYVEIKGLWRYNDREKVNAFIERGNPLIVLEDVKNYKTQNEIQS